jgi:hypothetical protein
LDKRIFFFKSRFHRPNDLIDDQRRIEHQLAFFLRAFDENFLALRRFQQGDPFHRRRRRGSG